MAEYEELYIELERLVARMTAADVRSDALAEASLACLQAALLSWTAIRGRTGARVTSELRQEALNAVRAASIAVRYAMLEHHGGQADAAA